MNKQEFTVKVKEALRDLPQTYVDEQIGFYAEIIDDKIEEGIAEEQAVSSVGTIDEIASGILEGIPFSMIVKEKLKTKKRRPGALVFALLILGSPIYLSLFVAAAVVVFSLYAAAWSVVVSLWVLLALIVISGVVGAIIGTIFAAIGNIFSGIVIISVGITLAGCLSSADLYIFISSYADFSSLLSVLKESYSLFITAL